MFSVLEVEKFEIREPACQVMVRVFPGWWKGGLLAVPACGRERQHALGTLLTRVLYTNKDCALTPPNC